MSDEKKEPVGSVAEEAAKLLAALQGWAKDTGGDYADAAATAAAGAAEKLHEVNEHIAHGEDCRYCPVCQVISAVRSTSPEVRQHLSTAASSLLQAASGLLETYGASSPARQDPSGVEKIDLSDDGHWDDDAWEDD